MSKIAQISAAITEHKRSARNRLENHSGRRWTSVQQAEHARDLESIERLEAQALTIEAHENDSDITVLDASAMMRARRGRPVDADLVRYIRGGFDAFEPEELRIMATLSTTTPSQGGYTVSSNVYPELAEIQKRYSAVRDGAQVVASETGGPLIWPVSDPTAEVGELLAENITATAADPVFASTDLKAYRFSSKLIVAPFEFLNDPAIDVQAFILARCGARIGRSQNAYFTTGTGTLQPTGFLPTASVGKIGSTGSTITCAHADLVDLLGSVDPAYRKAPGACWMMNDTTLRMVRKIADTTNARPLYTQTDSLGELLLGYPISVNNDMPSPGANVRSIAFGDFHSGYKIVDLANGVVLLRMVDSVYASKGQVAFVAYQRSAGNLVDSRAVQVFVHSAT